MKINKYELGIDGLLKYLGEENVDDDAITVSEPTQLDKIEAQVTYTAMMTDTLLEV